MEIKVIKADITTLHVDAIVNAANGSLLGGGGVDGAIHNAAGIELLEECITLNGCEPGKAKITMGYNLPAKYVIHTVGPIWMDDEKEKEYSTLLSECYKNSLLLAIKHNITTIAFPNISTGAYHFPKDKAANIAISTTKLFISKEEIETVFFACFDDENFKQLNSALLI